MLVVLVNIGIISHNRLMTEMRLQKLLSQAGVASRRKAEELISAGKVMVNGQVATIGQQVDPQADTVTVRGKTITAPQQYTYLVLHKPAGYTSTRARFKNEQSVYDLLPRHYRQQLWPVGRLDKPSEGLLIFTNDGQVTELLTHPRHGHGKQYQVDFVGTLDAAAQQQLATGVMIDGYKTAPATITLVKPQQALVTLKEGKKRQVRQMFRAVNCTVKRLVRIKEGKLQLAGLASGQWKEVQKEDIL